MRLGARAPPFTFRLPPGRCLERRLLSASVVTRGAKFYAPSCQLGVVGVDEMGWNGVWRAWLGSRVLGDLVYIHHPLHAITHCEESDDSAVVRHPSPACCLRRFAEQLNKKNEVEP